ncbi:hypothetical protein TNCV_2619351 [Trichonephila clavipes]|uniref:Uncharacterized protein n=1 Tax=Trichonephila clavipes TaxID=2585209 RepID=A0A8X7BMI3_TRICX|nr:hypothetical protein TNCV_2619351 [Trichonephila clavipes]
MAKHKPRKLAPTEYTTDEEDLIMYDVQDEELQTHPTDKFAITEYHRNNPDKYTRALTPTRFRKSTPIDADLRERILKLGPYQPEGTFQKDAKGRSFSSSYYSFISKAGKKIERKWLCYSTRIHVAYCQKIIRLAKSYEESRRPYNDSSDVQSSLSGTSRNSRFDSKGKSFEFSKDLLAPELINYTASASKDQLAPALTNYTASISYDISMVKSTNNNTSVSYDLPAADLLTKKALNLEDVHKIKSFSLSTTGQLETVNNSTSTPASTVKTSVVLLASEGKAAVNDIKHVVLSAERNLLAIHVPFVKIRCSQYVEMQ